MTRERSLEGKLENSMYTIAANYHFLDLVDPSALREELRAIFASTDQREARSRTAISF